VEKQAHYIVAVKNNPPGLDRTVESLFEATDADLIFVKNLGESSVPGAKLVGLD